MSFNSGKTFKEMLAAAGEIAGERWPDFSAAMEQALEQERDALRELASEWMRSGLSDKELDAKLQQFQQRFSTFVAKQNQVEPELLERTVQAALNSYWKSLMEAL